MNAPPAFEAFLLFDGEKKFVIPHYITFGTRFHQPNIFYLYFTIFKSVYVYKLSLLFRIR